MRFHGVLPLKPGWHAMTGPYRYNLTFRHLRCG
jgi:alkylated DNA repair protein (DNA oxidative demethylase)